MLTKSNKIVQFELPNNDVDFIKNSASEYLLKATKIERGNDVIRFEFRANDYLELKKFLSIAGYKQADGSWDYDNPDWDIVNRYEDLIDDLYNQVMKNK